MFTIFITHTSFQLYHAHFPATYLKAINDPPVPPIPPSEPTSQEEHPSQETAVHDPEDLPSLSLGDGITLRSTPLYDFCDVEQRGQWLDMLVALIEYLRSGECRVGVLNRGLPSNRLH